MIKNVKKALGIDIGGTKIYAAIVDEEGKILSEPKKYKTPKNIDEIKKILSQIINENAQYAAVAAIATAGAVSNDNKRILSSTANMGEGYQDINFQSLSPKIPVFIENDANCAAWAEHTTGAAKGSAHSITLTLGTGVGGGIIINNILLKGKSGAAGEMHFKMSTGRQRLCTCGAYDCFEIYASGTGLVLTAKDVLNKEMTTYEIIEGVKNKDDDCIRTFSKWQEYIKDGIVGLNDIFDTEVVVLSGSMGAFADVEYIEKAVNKEIVTSPVRVKHASAGNYAGIIGSALLAMKILND